VSIVIDITLKILYTYTKAQRGTKSDELKSEGGNITFGGKINNSPFPNSSLLIPNSVPP
jgi:hypothetical protein